MFSSWDLLFKETGLSKDIETNMSVFGENIKLCLTMHQISGYLHRIKEWKNFFPLFCDASFVGCLEGKFNNLMIIFKHLLYSRQCHKHLKKFIINSYACQALYKAVHQDDKFCWKPWCEFCQRGGKNMLFYYFYILSASFKSVFVLGVFPFLKHIMTCFDT